MPLCFPAFWGGRCTKERVVGHGVGFEQRDYRLQIRAVLMRTLAEIADRFIQLTPSAFRGFLVFSRQRQQRVTFCYGGDYFQ